MLNVPALPELVKDECERPGCFIIARCSRCDPFQRRDVLFVMEPELGIPRISVPKLGIELDALRVLDARHLDRVEWSNTARRSRAVGAAVDLRFGRSDL